MIKFNLTIKHLAKILIMSNVILLFNPLVFAQPTSVKTTDSTISANYTPTTQPKNPNAPFVLYSGIFDDTGSATVPTDCPTGFTAYPTLEGGDQQLISSTVIATNNKYCLNGFYATGSTIFVNIATTTNYKTYTTNTNPGRYMANNHAAYTAGSSTPFPTTYTINSEITQTDAIKNVHYIITCYPTGIAPTAVSLC